MQRIDETPGFVFINGIFANVIVSSTNVFVSARGLTKHEFTSQVKKSLSKKAPSNTPTLLVTLRSFRTDVASSLLVTSSETRLNNAIFQHSSQETTYEEVCKLVMLRSLVRLLDKTIF